MSLREEFIKLLHKEALSFTELCCRYGISRKTGYKWAERFKQSGIAGLEDASRRPRTIARHIDQNMEEKIVELRTKHSWGSRKIRRRLQVLDFTPVPACSTITRALHRNNLVDPERPGSKNWQRFEHPAPNCLWQMDFKAPVPTLAGVVHPLTVLDDHSRFNICLRALPDQRTAGVQSTLTEAFGLYGLPDTILVDNGSPWGNNREQRHTALTVWLMRINVGVAHSRPYHPQTLGKGERFHRTLEEDLIGRYQWRDLVHLQRSFDPWRHTYNFERPHDSLGLDVPADRYRPSLRAFPETLPEIEYPAGIAVRKVEDKGRFCFKGKHFRVGKAFRGYPVGLRATDTDGVYDVMFCHHIVTHIDLRID
jgi:transposase InsO family protein